MSAKLPGSPLHEGSYRVRRTMQRINSGAREKELSIREPLNSDMNEGTEDGGRPRTTPV